ncbi:MAG: hypothetical protein ABSF99_07800 [Anaerolineales bacterium]|jgi:hypothetical protein
MKKRRILLFVTLLLAACVPIHTNIEVGVNIQTAIAQTQAVWTPVSTYTPQPTFTPQSTLVINRALILPPTPRNPGACKPLTTLDYSDISKIAVQLQTYVSQLPDVKSVSSAIPEKLYSNTRSELFFVEYTSTDGQNYAKRYIVYMKEFGWQNATFSIDGQCWIDSPH